MSVSLEARAEAGIAILESYAGGLSSWRWKVIGLPQKDRFELEYHNEDHVVRGRFYSDDAGAACFHVMWGLQEGRHTFLRIPRPIFYDADQHLLLYEPPQGASCRDLDFSKHPDTLYRTGVAMREIHESRVESVPVKSMKNHIDELVHPHPAKLAAAFPGFADIIKSTLDRLVAHRVQTPQAVLHRDFSTLSLFDDGRHITVSHWDHSAAGDPAFDVGCFIAFLKTNHPETEAGIASFLEGYGTDAHILARTGIYETFSYLRSACNQYLLKEPGWANELKLMLGRLAA